MNNTYKDEFNDSHRNIYQQLKTSKQTGDVQVEPDWNGYCRILFVHFDFHHFHPATCRGIEGFRGFGRWNAGGYKNHLFFHVLLFAAHHRRLHFHFHYGFDRRRRCKTVETETQISDHLEIDRLHNDDSFFTIYVARIFLPDR